MPVKTRIGEAHFLHSASTTTTTYFLLNGRLMGFDLFIKLPSIFFGQHFDDLGVGFLALRNISPTIGNVLLTLSHSLLRRDSVPRR